MKNRSIVWAIFTYSIFQYSNNNHNSISGIGKLAITGLEQSEDFWICSNISNELIFGYLVTNPESLPCSNDQALFRYVKLLFERKDIIT